MKSREEIKIENIGEIGEASFPADEVIRNIGEIVNKKHCSSVETVPYPKISDYEHSEKAMRLTVENMVIFS